MTNRGYFKKGEIKPNQGKRGPSKTTKLAREAIASFVDGNAEKLQQWLDGIAEDPKHGPKAAFDCFMSVVEYHIPKLARTEHAGDKDNPVHQRIEMVIVDPNPGSEKT